MIQLFDEYKNRNNISDTLIIGRNMVNKAPGDEERFEAYINFLLYLAEKLPAIDEQIQFLNQAEIAMAFFEENADLSPELIDKINAYKEQISNINRTLNEAMEKKRLNAAKSQEMENQKWINELLKIEIKFSNINSQQEFDAILENISDIDMNIDHENLTLVQKKQYDQINKKFNACISDVMRELEYKNNVEYNQEAISSYERAFKKFKSNESMYKKSSQLYALVSGTLFAYDAARLFNETLIYYNHIYSYIFSKLDDHGKFELTKYSIECERKRR